MAQLIDNRWIEGSGEEFTSSNPATGDVHWRGRAAGPGDVDAAYEAARKAFLTWGFTAFEERLAIIRAFGKLLETNRETLIDHLCRDTGKVKWDARNEINGMIGKIDVSLAAYHERTGTREGEGAGFKTALRHKPHGVLAVFGPYNFPAHLPNGHIVPALLAGNTIVYKPSEHTPFITETIVKLWQEAGLPAGVINLLHGMRETGERIVAHDELDGLLFTGSSDTGKILHQQFAGRPDKILALELGGNNPLIAWDVSDVKAASYQLIQASFMTTGQRCTCTRRLIVKDGAAGEKLVQALLAMTKTLRIGAYTDMPEPFMGPLINNTEAGKLMKAQENLESLGGKVLLRMERRDAQKPFLTPAIIDVTGINAPDREYFGPLLQVIRVKDFESALKEANNTQFGLASGIFTDDRKLFEQFFARTRAGVCNWNRPTTGSSATLPFGGVNFSGNHRPSAYYAADYCAWPVASSYNEKLELPAALSPGLTL